MAQKRNYRAWCGSLRKENKQLKEQLQEQEFTKVLMQSRIKYLDASLNRFKSLYSSASDNLIFEAKQNVELSEMARGFCEKWLAESRECNRLKEALSQHGINA